MGLIELSQNIKAVSPVYIPNPNKETFQSTCRDNKQLPISVIYSPNICDEGLLHIVICLMRNKHLRGTKFDAYLMYYLLVRRDVSISGMENGLAVSV